MGSAVCDYLSGKGTLREIQKKYGIRSDKRPVQTKNPTRNCVPSSKMPTKKRRGSWDTTAENISNRELHAERFGEKWLTDVTGMKYGASGKACLSAILDLADKSVVSFVIGHSNNNALVFETFDIAHENHPDAKPLSHSDRGYQYTSKSFCKKLNKAGMTQSMSRVSRCIDNEPMEAFWGMLKSEMYYLKKYQTYGELKEAISDYIDYYNNHRYQKRLNCMTPIEYRNYLKGAA